MRGALQVLDARLLGRVVDDHLVNAVGQVDAFLRVDALYEQSRERFAAASSRLDDLLADSIQPAARAELAAAVEQASGIAHQANVLITRGLLLALLAGVLAAMATVRAVR